MTPSHAHNILNREHPRANTLNRRSLPEASGKRSAPAEAYIRAAVLSPGMRADAQHIAIATVGRVDVLVSWNFKHIVNLERIRGYNSVNLRQGYPLIEIRTPREVVSDE